MTSRTRCFTPSRPATSSSVTPIFLPSSPSAPFRLKASAGLLRFLSLALRCFSFCRVRHLMAPTTRASIRKSAMRGGEYLAMRPAMAYSGCGCCTTSSQ